MGRPSGAKTDLIGVRESDQLSGDGFGCFLHADEGGSKAENVKDTRWSERG